MADEMEVYREKMRAWREAKQQRAELEQIYAQRQARVQEIRAKAKFDAENFEKRYTTRQKAEIAKWNKAQQDIDNNSDYSEAEKKQIKSKIDMLKLGIKPVDLPKLSPHPRGQDVGDAWTDQQTGDGRYRDKDGVIHTTDYKKTKEGAYQASLHAAQAAELKHKQDIAKDAGKFREKNMWDDKYDNWGHKIGRQLVHPDEINRRIQVRSGMTPTPPQTPSQQVDPKVQQAHALLQETFHRYKTWDQVPADQRQNVAEAVSIVRSGQQPQQQQQQQQAPVAQQQQNTGPTDYEQDQAAQAEEDRLSEGMDAE